MRHEGLIADRIRRGEPPDAGSVSEIAAAGRARLGDGGVESARALLASEVLGLGPLEACVADRRVTDVLVNGDGTVWPGSTGCSPAGSASTPSSRRWSTGAPT